MRLLESRPVLEFLSVYRTVQKYDGPSSKIASRATRLVPWTSCQHPIRVNTAVSKDLLNSLLTQLTDRFPKIITAVSSSESNNSSFIQLKNQIIYELRLVLHEYTQSIQYRSFYIYSLPRSRQAHCFQSFIRTVRVHSNLSLIRIV